MTPTRPRILTLITTCLIITALLTTPVTAAAQENPQQDPDTTIIRIYIHDNGTAEWVFQTRTRLTNDTDVTAFKDFQATYKNNSTKLLSQFQTRMNAVAQNAENQTGRDMPLTKFSTSTTIQEAPQQWGIVEIRFQWKNFATTTNNTLTVGDAFEGGWYLSNSDTLEIHAPENYHISTTTPTPTEETTTHATWTGETSFTNQQPHLEFTPDTTPPATPPTQPPIPPKTLAGATIATLLILIGALLWQRSNTPDNPPQPTVQTDKERIINLLEENDGRMKQTAINNAFNWSKSKTSIELSSLEDTHTIEKLRVGRENIITLTD